MTRTFLRRHGDFLRQRGQSMTEYLVACAALATGLFAGTPSLAEMLSEALRSGYHKILFSLSLPL